MKLATILASVAFVASAGFGIAADHDETNGLRGLANAGAGGSALSHAQGEGHRLLDKSEPAVDISKGLVDAKSNVARRMVAISGNLAGELGPGSYDAAAAVTLTGVLTLDASGNILYDGSLIGSPAGWTFTIGAAFATAAASTMVFKNGVTPVTEAQANALAAYVTWHVTGAIALGASSTAIGQMTATGAIAVGAGVTCGDIHSIAGAITLGAGATGGDLTAAGAIGLGADATAGVLVAGGAVTLGANAGAVSATAGGAAITLGAGASMTGFMAAELGNTILVPGDYIGAAAVGLTGKLTLDASGVVAGTGSNYLWTFTTGGAFNTAAASKMVFVRGNVEVTDQAEINALALRVLWDVTGAITLGASSISFGIMQASAAITVGASAKCGVLDAGAAITLGAGAVFESIVNEGTTTVTYGAGAHAAGDVPSLGAVLTGLTLDPGTHTSAGAVGLAGTLTFYSPSSPSVVTWNMVIGGALNTAAASQMVFLIGATLIEPGDAQYQALADLVTWDVTGAITLGAGSAAAGHMTASGAITVGASATCGDLFATGAITLGAGAVYQSVGAVGAITYGAGAHQAGAVPPLGAALGGLTFLPGTHTAAAAVGLTGDLYLDATGIVTGDIWTFVIGGAFNTAAASKMVFLINSVVIEPGDAQYQALADLVTWDVTGAITLGASSVSVGLMDSDAAITVGAGAICGDLKAVGAITLGAGAVFESIVNEGTTTVTYGAGAHAADAAPSLGADLGVMDPLPPGVYTRAAAIGLTGTLTLDTTSLGLTAAQINARSVTDPLWEFVIGGAFTTTANSEMIFLPDLGFDVPTMKKLRSLVVWDVTGAITLGAGSTAIGTMDATGAITVGATAVCGVMRAGGAVTVGAGAVALSAVSTSGAAVTMGAGAYALGSLAADIGGMTLVPGAYTGAAATGLTTTLTLDNPTHIASPTWLFTVTGAFTTAAASSMVFTQAALDAGATDASVIWVVHGAITVGASAFAIGDMTADGAITVGASSEVGILRSAAITVGAGSTYVSLHGAAQTLGAGAVPK